MLQGRIFLFDTLTNTKTITLDTLRGMPIMPKTDIHITPGSQLMISYYDGGSYMLGHGETYSYRSLGTRKDTYNVSISASNGFYYARISSFDSGIVSAHAELTLLAPQLAADTQ